MAMNKERMGEIALVIFKDRILSDGIRVKKDLWREAAASAQSLGYGITAEELMEMYEIVVREAVDKAFAKKK